MKIVEKIIGKRIDLLLNEVSPSVPEKQFVDCLSYNICLKSGEAIGTISAKLGMNEVVYYVGNIGYGIDEKYRGHGYAPEAVELIKEVFIKNDFHKVIITNDPQNTSSKRVCEKVGAKLVKKAEIPPKHFLRAEQNHTYMNIWELNL